MCKKCKGIGRLWYKVGTHEWDLSEKIISGLWAGITKHSNDRGWNRR